MERILKVRRTGWEAQDLSRGEYKEPRPPDTSVLPPMPEGWVWTRVEHLIDERPCNGKSMKWSDRAEMVPGVVAPGDRRATRLRTGTAESLYRK